MSYGRLGVKVWVYKGEVMPVIRRPEQKEGETK